MSKQIKIGDAVWVFRGKPVEGVVTDTAPFSGTPECYRVETATSNEVWLTQFVFARPAGAADLVEAVRESAADLVRFADELAAQAV